MARTITVIWSDENCDGSGEHHVQELNLDLTPTEVRETLTDTLVYLAMVACYKDVHSEEYARALADSAIKDYGLVGIINGVVEWLH